ncbi:serine protease [Streptomyces sp. NBC_01462]|uniref:serine protease n=1 Tax=Streptomyces sp. NBC_01462 TaxID=2903876 RepID=UPI002E38138C|nr:serine protease [Streptomyces sp. NBC_01462]
MTGISRRALTAVLASFALVIGMSAEARGIVNGDRVTSPAKYPWMAQIQILRDGRRQGSCAGTLVSERWVLTAGHCVDSQDIRVVLGSTALRSETDGSFRVVRVVRHPRYAPGGGPLRYDAALLRLDPPVRFGRTVAPLALPASARLTSYPGPLVVAGWGHTREDGPASDTLLETHQTESGRCFRQGLRRKVHLCTLIRGHRAPCYGDSGAPLMHRNARGGFTLVGITSGIVGSHPCGAEGQENYFARVTALVDWIRHWIHHSTEPLARQHR